MSVFKDSNLTQDTAGVTLTTNYDGVTGLNFVSISTSTAFYVDGSSYECVITTGTVVLHPTSANAAITINNFI